MGKVIIAGIDFGTALNAVMTFIGNPHDIWVSGGLNQKRLVQKLVFRRPLMIDPSQVIGTAALSLPFKLLKDIKQAIKVNWGGGNGFRFLIY